MMVNTICFGVTYAGWLMVDVLVPTLGYVKACGNQFCFPDEARQENI